MRIVQIKDLDKTIMDPVGKKKDTQLTCGPESPPSPLSPVAPGPPY